MLALGAVVTEPSERWFEGVESTITRWYPQTASDITSDANSRTIHGQKCAFTTRTTAACVCSIVWVSRTPKERIATFKSKHCLGYICLDKWHGTYSNQLLRKLGEMNER